MPLGRVCIFVSTCVCYLVNGVPEFILERIFRVKTTVPTVATDGCS
jgi:hypothetical protein